MVQKKSLSVAILMCTYNGENFLEEQLDSIENQDYKNWTLYVNDDGSKDATLDILKRYQKKWGNKKLHIRRGPQKGFSQNFLQIICDKKINADIVEFHTGEFCLKTKNAQKKEFANLKNCAKYAHQLGLECHAGHGLDYITAKQISQINEIIELNIGHFLIGEAIFFGLDKVIKKMLKAIKR